MKNLQKVLAAASIIATLGFTACVDDEEIAPNEIVVYGSPKDGNATMPADTAITDNNNDPNSTSLSSGPI